MDRPVDANGAEIASSTVTEAVYTRLRTDILLGEWRPSDRLKLDRLRQRYAASVNTLREALSRLVSEGLVANEGQRGFTVVGASLADLQDITEMRAMLECNAARRSIERADLDWESRVVGAYHKLSRVESLVDSDPTHYAPLLELYNREFHNALIANCGSKWLLVFHGVMYDQSLRYRMLAFKVTDFPREQSRREHKEILDAALARDGGRLAKLLSAHIGKGADLYAESHLAEPGSDKPTMSRHRAKAKRPAARISIDRAKAR
jgi:GntR family transcriptional regulator, carbon starvation induced regulator